MSPAVALGRALDLLEREQPAYYARMVEALEGLVVQCRVDDLDFTVTGDATLVLCEQLLDHADILAASSHRAILDLIDARTTLLGAVRGRGLKVRADIRLMVRLSQAQRAFAEGAARTRSMRDVLDAYRRDGAPVA